MSDLVTQRVLSDWGKAQPFACAATEARTLNLGDL
jgi:hypothetical protein